MFYTYKILIVNFPIARSTLAVVFLLGVNTLMAALVHKHIFAFIHSAVQRLVRIITAVIHFVTDGGIVDALFVVASKLAVRTNVGHHAAAFIRAVAAVVFAIASRKIILSCINLDVKKTKEFF